jgi:hypothetical protein
MANWKYIFVIHITIELYASLHACKEHVEISKYITNIRKDNK